MKDLLSAAPMLLNDLYERATEPERWPEFLGKFASFFHSDTATLRLTDLRHPVIYQSYTVGFRQHINQHYESEATSVELDPFRLALATSACGLGLKGNRLQLSPENMSGALGTMIRKLTENQSLTETLRLGQTGACLVMMQSHQSDTGFHIGRALTPQILCFLLDSGRPAQLDQTRLSTMYQLTPAEYRLASLLMNDLDVNEASALLQISPHTGRTQLKSIMQKTGVNRQTALQRKLLLCADTLRKRNE